MKTKKYFLENISMSDTTKRLKDLKQLYDNRKISEKEITDEDIDKLIEMYDKEIKELKADTERRKENITKIIKNYKK